MKGLAALAVAAGVWSAPGLAMPPIADPVLLNIGLNCHWDAKCMSSQKSAMRKSLKYVAKYQPPQWRLHMCNRNASRSTARVDWVGFDKCVRNESLRPPPPPPPPAPRKKPARKRR